jgi:transcriptional regulator with XRE-family HTH domain
MSSEEGAVERCAAEAALRFGRLIRSRRKALGMRQDQLALASGVGRRFLIELEAGKASCQLGRSLLVAEALGLGAGNVLATGGASSSTCAPDLPDPQELPDQDLAGQELPDLVELEEDADGQPAGVL